MFWVVGNDQAPLPFAIVVPSFVAPSKTVTVEPASADPAKFHAPLTRTALVIAGCVGGVVSTVNANAALCA